MSVRQQEASMKWDLTDVQFKVLTLVQFPLFCSEARLSILHLSFSCWETLPTQQHPFQSMLAMKQDFPWSFRHGIGGYKFFQEQRRVGKHEDVALSQKEPSLTAAAHKGDQALASPCQLGPRCFR